MLFWHICNIYAYTMGNVIIKVYIFNADSHQAFGNLHANKLIFSVTDTCINSLTIAHYRKLFCYPLPFAELLIPVVMSPVFH